MRSILVVLIIVVGHPAPTLGQEPRYIDFWSCDNVTSSFAASGDLLIAAGGFSDWGPSSGHGIMVGRPDASNVPGFPKVAGAVEVCVPDGDGGLLLGGHFVAIGGVPRAGLAHIRSDGSLGSWAPRVTGTVLTLARQGGVVYIGGAFDRVNGESRRNLAAVDTLTGNLLPWDPHPNGRVLALLTDSMGVFVGGEFDSIAGEAHWALARFDGHPGLLSPWQPFVGPSYVSSLLTISDTLYFGGTFWNVGPIPRRNVAAIDLTTGILTAWNPIVDQPESRSNGSANVMSLTRGDGTIYLGGKFRTVGGVVREALAEVDAVSGSLTGWDPRILGFDYGEYIIADVKQVVVDDSSVWIAGRFPSAGGQTRLHAAQIDRHTGQALPWNPQLTFHARTVSPEPGRVFLGGYFNSHGDQRYRRHLIAFRRSNLSIDSLVIETDGWSIESMVAKGDTLYAVGFFQSLGNAPHAYLGAVDLRTGQSLDWHADLNGYAYKLRLIGDDLYVCGDFTMAAGQPRSRVARFDTRTGHLSPWNPLPDDTVYDLSVDKDNVYMVGFFDRVGTDSTGPIAVVDRLDGSLRGTRFGQIGIVEAVVVIDSTLFAGGVMYTTSNPTRRHLQAFNTRTGLPTLTLPLMRWSQSTQTRVHTIERVGDTLYFGGAIDTVGGRYQAGAAAIHVRTGQLLDWNPGFFAGDRPNGGVVWGIQRLGDLLAVGGRFEVAANWPAGGIALFSLGASDSGGGPGPSPGPPEVISLGAIVPNPVIGNATVRFQLPRAATVRLEVFDLAGRRVRTLLDGVPHAPGQHEVQLLASAMPKGVYWCRLEAGHERSAKKFVVLE